MTTTIDPTIGTRVLRAGRAGRQAEAELRAYLEASPQPEARELAAGLNERLALIAMARERAEHARCALIEADRDARLYAAELERLEQRHRRAVARVARKYGRSADNA